jgi:hypothetical protein
MYPVWISLFPKGEKLCRVIKARREEEGLTIELQQKPQTG